MTPFDLAIAYLVAARGIELILAASNTSRLRAAGAVEHGKGHYPAIVALHALWIAALWLFVPRDTVPNELLLGVFALLQLARIWVIASLGRYWTTRILTLPGVPLVRRGPYRFVRHPNYLVVALEIPVLSGAFHAWWLALAFGLANLAILNWRIRAENRALAPRRSLEARQA
ncbi:MAG TPA: isoprenylcysteine carboxylmethyltransferase family protein [Hypericibacter adhaerens]|jgi:methyltransferase|uniref:Membrane protein n=1 Tax=Hypericibacter adhaerens TaxID=2602016 RepID=A0A5J6MYJ4_9PROT|nr:isoprenylcysteine carboxylmethyltransferase family protein [Hypericibacter adhaerens]QEX22177.1 membrane protein [Hypericibacter adhaerens]HWA46459.1 isoprenylcysteine carboxylmethyltransferase family protein [Hypericibacter adhaerens]